MNYRCYSAHMVLCLSIIFSLVTQSFVSVVVHQVASSSLLASCFYICITLLIQMPRIPFSCPYCVTSSTTGSLWGANTDYALIPSVQNGYRVTPLHITQWRTMASGIFPRDRLTATGAAKRLSNIYFLPDSWHRTNCGHIKRRHFDIC